MVIAITTQNFEKEVKNSKKPIILDVYATWCGPCQYMSPIFEELSKELSDKYKFCKLNIDEEREIAIKYNISSIPTFVFIKDGNVAKTEMGFMEKETLKKKIEDILE